MLTHPDLFQRLIWIHPSKLCLSIPYSTNHSNTLVKVCQTMHRSINNQEILRLLNQEQILSTYLMLNKEHVFPRLDFQNVPLASMYIKQVGKSQTGMNLTPCTRD